MPHEDAIAALVSRAIEERLFPGAEILIARQGEIRLHAARGTLDGTPEHPLRKGMLHDLASLTKPVATATLLLRLADEGLLSLDDPVQRYLPEFTGPGKSRITLRALAAHQAGLPASAPLYDTCATPDEARARLMSIPLDYPPGKGVVYSCLGYLVLGAALEGAAGARLDTLFQRHVAGPLGMADSLFRPLEHGTGRHRIVPSGHRRGTGELLRGTVHDSTCARLGGTCGNAGLFSTAADLLAFAHMVLGQGPRFLSCQAREAMRANQSPPGASPRSIGWEINIPGAPASCGPGFPAGAIGHTGFTGTSLWLDPATGLIVIVLSNRTMFAHDATIEPMRRFRHDLHTLAARA